MARLEAGNCSEEELGNFYAQIKDIAHNARVKGVVVARDELANALSSCGVQGDSAALGRLVYRAYNSHFGHDWDIYHSLVSNGGNQPLAEQGRMSQLSRDGEELDKLAERHSGSRADQGRNERYS